MTRSTVAQVAQIGKEAVAGTAVAATRRLASVEITPSIQSEQDTFRPRGLKFPTVVAQNKEWANLDLGGQPTYDEIVYPLSGAIDVATVSELMDGATPTSVYEWVFQPAPDAPDAPVTFTLENGTLGGDGERFAHALFTGVGLEISRSGVSLSGSGFARAAEAGFALTPALAVDTNLSPILPGQFSVYAAATQAALDSTAPNRVGRVIQANPSIGDRYNPAWFVDSSQPSFTTFVENGDGATSELALTVEADTNGMAWLDRMRAGTTYFIRLEALGRVLYNAGTQPNLAEMFRWDMAVKVESADAWSDEDGIYALPWTMRPVHDADLGSAHKITVRNAVQAL